MSLLKVLAAGIAGSSAEPRPFQSTQSCSAGQQSGQISNRSTGERWPTHRKAIVLLRSCGAPDLACTVSSAVHFQSASSMQFTSSLSS